MIHSRRQFLAVSAAAAGASIFDMPSILRAEAPEFSYGGLPMGIQSYTLRNFNQLEALHHIQELNLHWVEFYSKHFNPNASPKDIDTMKKTLARAKISISAHGVNGFTKNHDANRKLFEFAKAAGFKNLTANPQPDSFDSLDKLCEEYKIRICIHNHGPGALYDSLESVQKAVKDHHKLIGVCVDTGHVIRSAEDPVKWVSELGPRVFALHVKDVAEQQKRTHDVILGKGHLDVVALFKTLRKINFPADGSISLEYESNPKNPIADIKECLAIVNEAVEKSKG